MRLILAEDSTLLREALIALLERLGHQVVAAVEDATDLVTEFQRFTDADSAPDLVLTDVRMPPNHRDDGLLAALEIRRRVPTQPVLVLSQYVAGGYARKLLTLPEGGVGYLLKDRVNRVRDFARDIDVVASRGTVIDPEVVQLLLTRGDAGPLAQLSQREREVLALMARGQANSEIASTLVLTLASVSKHVGNIFMKLGLPAEEENRRVKAVLTYLDAVS